MTIGAVRLSLTAPKEATELADPGRDRENANPSPNVEAPGGPGAGDFQRGCFLNWKTNDPAIDAAIDAAAVDAIEGRSLSESSDPAYLEARASFDAAVLGLALSVATPPPPHLRARILASLQSGGSVEAVVHPRPGVTLVRSTAKEWREGPLPGVSVKRIHKDEKRRTESFLLRLEPGSRYPDHSHSFVEEIFVIEGSFSSGGQVLRAGDYCRSEPGTADHGIFSAEGTLFLVTLSEKQ